MGSLTSPVKGQGRVVLCSDQEKLDLLNKYDGFCFDLDGERTGLNVRQPPLEPHLRSFLSQSLALSAHCNQAMGAMSVPSVRLVLVLRVGFSDLGAAGTIWKGSTLIPGVLEVLTLLRQLGKKIFFVTNNSSKSRAAYAAKMAKLGLKAQQVRPHLFVSFVSPQLSSQAIFALLVPPSAPLLCCHRSQRSTGHPTLQRCS